MSVTAICLGTVSPLLLLSFFSRIFRICRRFLFLVIRHISFIILLFTYSHQPGLNLDQKPGFISGKISSVVLAEVIGFSDLAEVRGSSSHFSEL